jgi:hypothetical protein
VHNLHPSALHDFIWLLTRDRLDKTQRDNFSLLCSQITDWEALGYFCEDHGIGPLALNILSSIPETSPQVLRVFQDIAERSLARSVILIQRLQEILEELESQHIAALVLKGPVLAEILYSSPALRPFEDLDLLIKPEDMGRAVGILKKIDFHEIFSERERQFLESGFHRKFRTLQGVVVELHWELLHPDFCALPVSAVWEKAQTRMLYGRNIKTLSDTDQFIYACVHLAKHLCTHALTKGIWISDLERLLPAKISQALSARIRKLHCRRMVFFAVSLLYRFLNFTPGNMESWGHCLEISPTTQKLIWKNASPSQVFRSPYIAVSLIKKMINRLLMAEDTKTILRFPVAYLKRRSALIPRQTPFLS